MFPADELHELRCQIRALRAREAVLRARMIADPGGPACVGAAWQGVVVSRESRSLDMLNLPAEVLANPSAFRTRMFRAVLLRPAGAGSAADARPRRLVDLSAGLP